ncbi:MAG: ABC transporter permease [Vicinamibacterales bacterium]
MTFVVRMALREIRASWQRLLFFFVCIAIGVGSIVALRSVIQSVRDAISRESRALIAADVLITSDRPFTELVTGTLEQAVREARITGQSEAVEISTMVRPADESRTGTRMVELRAVGDAFPFYGTLTLRDGEYTHALLRDRGALVRPELLAQLGLSVGDGLLIGTVPFEIRGVIAAEPGRRVGAFSLGPRVLIDRADLDGTGLLGFGSRASHQLLLRVPAPLLDTVTEDLTATFSEEFLRVRSYRRSEDQMGENLTRAENYLSLVGLVVLILGGIGVSSVTRVFVQQKIRSIAILKCVGSSSAQILGVYMSQVMFLGLAGSILGVALAGGAVALVPRFVGDVAALFQVEYGLTTAAVLQGLLIGLLASLLFSIVPMLEVRHIKPSLLLRQDIPAMPSFDWLKWLVAGAVATLLVGVAAWQAGSLTVGLVLSAGFVVTAFVLNAAGAALIRAVQPLRHARSFALRQAVLHVARPGNQTRVILLAVGLGTFFILGVRGLQDNLLRDFAVQVGEDAPDMFLIDIQPAQREGVERFLDARNGDEPAPVLMPVLRARITGVQGREVAVESYEQVRGRGSFSREYTITYRPHLESNEQLLAGRWWDASPVAGEAEVSVEEGLVERFGLEIGDRMRFDVLGREVIARVTSIREVDWRNFRAGGFMLVFRPGTFEDAPHTYMSTFRAPSAPDVRARMQSDLVASYPNVSVIDLREILDTIQGIVGTVTIAVTVVGGLVMLSGVLILVGAVSMTKFRRVYEAAILKTLGANGRLIASMLLLEYGVLGAIAGTVGSVGAVALGWAVATFALELSWEPAPLLTLGGIAGTAILVATIGVLASLDVLRHKPLATLRAE